MATTLVIVESPAKAKTIGKYLGSGYTVYASKGHVRDLPEKGLGVDVESGTFAPEYKIKSGQWQTVTKIKEAAHTATNILLATDPDREGEAIAWHILIAAGLSRAKNVRRVEFHEITPNAIKKAIANPRAVDMNLVDAQQARRVLDRLVGYKISPLLWNKVQKGLSAGRVQSVALRIIVEREEDIEEFVPREFWTVEADLAKQPFKGSKDEVFHAILWDKHAKESDTDTANSAKENNTEKTNTKGKGKKVEFEKGEQAQAVVETLVGASWSVLSLAKEPTKRYPSAPFTTSTLQQEASRKLRMLAKDTMKVAQQLYEGVSLGPEGNVGLITYMRTDSTQVSKEAQLAAREVIEKIFGIEYLPPSSPFYAKKAANAQEAHEAIRPTGASREPDAIRGFLSNEQYRLYRLIWQRFIASQMAPAILENTIVDINAQPLDNTKPPYLFRATGLRVVFPGFLAVYKLGQTEQTETNANSDLAKNLPPLAPADPLVALKLEPLQHFTQPPPRYSEATLVKTLEELGVGRPSTYATILSTIQDRGYVVKVGDKLGSAETAKQKAAANTGGRTEQRFHPTELGRAVNELLVARFPNIVDVKFTARMEQALDEVASGERTWQPLIADFYHPMMAQLVLAEREVAKIIVPDEQPFVAAAAQAQTATTKGGYVRKGQANYKKGSTNNYNTTYNSNSSRTAKSASTKTSGRQQTTSRGSNLAETTANYTNQPTNAATTLATTPTPRKTSRTKNATTLATTPASGAAMTVAIPLPAPETQVKKTKANTTSAPATSNSSEAINCDKCGKVMVQRKGPYGEFWGCSGFPNCRNTRK
jgi:DNA topoisomerase-1